MTNNSYISTNYNNSSRAKNRLFYLYFVVMSGMGAYKTTHGTGVVEILAFISLATSFIGVIGCVGKKFFGDRQKEEEARESAFKACKANVLKQYSENKKKEADCWDIIRKNEEKWAKFSQEEEVYCEEIKQLDRPGKSQKRTAKVAILINKIREQKESIKKNSADVHNTIKKIHEQNEKSLLELFYQIASYYVENKYIEVPKNMRKLSQSGIRRFVNKTNKELLQKEQKIEEQLRYYEITAFREMLEPLKENLGISKTEEFLPKYWYNKDQFCRFLQEYKKNPNSNRKTQRYLAMNAVAFLKDNTSPFSFEERVEKVTYIIDTLQTDANLKSCLAVTGAMLSKLVPEYTKIVQTMYSRTESGIVLFLVAAICNKKCINPLNAFDTDARVAKPDYDSMFIYELIRKWQLFDKPYVEQLVKNIDQFRRIDIKQGGSREHHLNIDQHKRLIAALVGGGTESISFLSIEDLLGIVLAFFGRKEESKSTLASAHETMKEMNELTTETSSAIGLLAKLTSSANVAFKPILS